MESLRRLGKPLHISATQNLILRAESQTPRVGETVFSDKLKPVGIVFDIFGPVSKPYISIKPYAGKSSSLKQILYTRSSKSRR